MTEFERALVNAFNDFFREESVDGIAYRRKQHRFSSQFVDILVDSADPAYYLAIENKSVKTSSANKLYFSQHFSDNGDLHQVERITDFLDRSGRTGLLAVELKRGRGKQRKAFLLPWDVVVQRFASERPGIPIEEMASYYEVERDGEVYDVAGLFNGGGGEARAGV